MQGAAPRAPEERRRLRRKENKADRMDKQREITQIQIFVIVPTVDRQIGMPRGVCAKNGLCGTGLVLPSSGCARVVCDLGLDA